MSVLLVPSLNHCKVLSVLSLQGQAFVPTTVAPKPVQTRECLPRYGVDYSGDLSVTLQGDRCLQWSSPRVAALSRTKDFIPEVTLSGNKCRNPDRDPEGPWCYVDQAGNVTVGYCDVELCGKDPEPDPVCRAMKCSTWF